MIIANIFLILTRIVWIIFFFFSSRRRHTRCYRDWSSDVCSSDLPPAHPHVHRRAVARRLTREPSESSFGSPPGLPNFSAKAIDETRVHVAEAVRDRALLVFPPEN